MYNAFVRYFLLNKRLFKKISFIILLCLVPVLVAAMRYAAKGDSSIFKIALYMENPDDKTASEMVKKLTEKKDQVLHYVICGSREEAESMVRDYEVDEAWVFPANLEEKLKEAAHDKVTEPVVDVIEREETISLIFTREILCDTLYPYFAYDVYEDFVRDDMGIDDADDEELESVYESNMVEEGLFTLAYTMKQDIEADSYLMAPVRGMLAIWLMLCGFAASMYYIQDEQRGTFIRIPENRRIWTSLASHAVLIFDAVIVLIAACRVAGVFTAWNREIVSAVLFGYCAMTFCNLVRIICRIPERLGSCIPVMLLGMMILSPVFININKWKALQFMLPPYYYLKSIYNADYLYAMAVYAVVMTALNILADRLRRKAA
jgi:ABC-2 type transport system permease protein